jgi:hypothetical protein
MNVLWILINKQTPLLELIVFHTADRENRPGYPGVFFSRVSPHEQDRFGTKLFIPRFDTDCTVRLYQYIAFTNRLSNTTIQLS